MKKIVKYLLFLSLLLNCTNSFSQFYSGLQMNFGKNRVQYSDKQIWSYFRFEKFDTYFYQNGRELAINTAKYCNSIMPVLEQKMQYSFENKIQFIIFNTMSDMKQSNVGLLHDDVFNVGGVTQVTGNKIVLYFDGSYRNFERQIRQGLARVMVNEIVFGEGLTSNIKNSALLFLPEWYTEGLISYIADDWNTVYDNLAKNGFLTGKYRKFNFLNGQDAAIAGHSIWEYVRNQYGEDVIPNIIYLTKISRSVENGFMFVLGITFKSISADWQGYYLEMYKNDIAGRTAPNNAEPIIPKKKLRNAYINQVKINSSGNVAAYSTDNLNKKEIWLQSLPSGKPRKIFRLGYRIDEARDFSYPLLAWHPGGELLAFVVEQKGKITLYLYNLSDKHIDKQFVFGVDKIHDLSYSPDGFSLLVSATINGQSDVFLYQLSSKTFLPITKDIFDDINPRFVLGGRYIAFSSNRLSDTIVFDKETYLRDYSKEISKSPVYNIYLYNVKTKSPLLWKITSNQFNDALMPVASDKNSFSFLDDNNGIFNRYISLPDSAINYVDTAIHYRYFSKNIAVTDYPFSIIEQNSEHTGNALSQIIFSENLTKLYSLFQEKKQVSPSPTNFMQRQQSKQLTLPVIQDSVKNTKETPVLKQSYQLQPGDSSMIDINNYVFKTKGEFRKDTLSKVKAVDSDSLAKKFQLPKQRNYDVEYSLNQLINQLDYSFLNYSYQLFTGGGPVYLDNGINAFLKAGMNDLLENYRLIGGVRLSFDLQNNEYLFGFENYSSRWNKQLLFHRKSTMLQNQEGTTFMKYRQHDIHYVLTYPFSHVFAFKTDFSLRKDIVHFLSSDYQNLIKNSMLMFWGGIKSELVFDNTRNPQTNIYFGTRGKFWAEYNQEISREKNNLIVLGLDVRHYIPIDRNFIWANRFAASSSMGNTLLMYYLGGVDNWLFPKFNNDVNISYDKNYLYQTLATNMRGFTQNIRNGNSFTVYNSELRFPVFRYLYNRPLRSQLLNNFQIVTFCDVGTAWEGLNPFSKDNSLFTSVISQKPITVIVRRQKNPIVGGFGPGLRTKLLGYFFRADYAWGIEDGKLLKPVFYLSLSLDF